MKVLIVIPCHNRSDTTLHCLNQIKDQLQLASLPYSVLIVDDGSTDGTTRKIQDKYPDVLILNGNGNLWWGGAINLGLGYGIKHGYDLIYLTNDDVEFTKTTLNNLIAYYSKSSNKNIILGSVIADSADNLVLSSGVVLQGWTHQMVTLNAGRPVSDLATGAIPVDMMSGKSMLIPRHVLSKVGKLDTEKFPHNFADFEFSYRAKRHDIDCLIITNSIIYTSLNPNYIGSLARTATTKQLVMSYFNKRYGHNIRNIFYSTFVFRPKILAPFFLIREFIRHASIITRSILQ